MDLDQKIENDIQPTTKSNDVIMQTHNIKTKNNGLQFYKFLLNSLKVEISINEFIGLIKMSNQAEIIIWIISISIYLMGSKQYPLVWIHVLHVFRAFVGMIILHKLPRSYELITHIIHDEKLMEMNNYNDIIRQAFNDHILPRLKLMKCELSMYLTLTIVNFMIDIVDFVYVMSYFSYGKENFQIVTFTFFVLNFLYIGSNY